MMNGDFFFLVYKIKFPFFFHSYPFSNLFNLEGEMCSVGSFLISYVKVLGTWILC